MRGDFAKVQAVKGQFALTFHQLIQLPQETLDFVETQAAQRSGIAQPDLGGMILVRGADESIDAAARALLALDEIEWAQFTMPNPEPPSICWADCEVPSQGPFCEPPVERCCDIDPETWDYFAACFSCAPELTGTRYLPEGPEMGRM